ncbi:hypothetical protein [Coleofasciculus sp. FACHB-1120]|uniref:hypothetical protein n=1 Tax=Coleofasciculus sp. FACHB-1120 TaxID=2692783 RepID=UPI001687B092|nr:hypothetical protein [Coleofasciculus sp. FACHB-1120]MBD2743410.1 hypothetical protein [Coleofasciculus sp. FACHB-1120]
MRKVLIVVDAADELAASPTTAKMVSALKQTALNSPVSTAIQVVETRFIASVCADWQNQAEILWCPLTLNLPENLEFPAQSLYQACRDVTGLRQSVEQLGHLTGVGDFWLPIVLTAKGPLYGEVIGMVEDDESRRSEPAFKCYRQPVHLSDIWRQPLYQLSHQLLQFLSAPPAVYLLQFGFQEQEIVFDRLLPFPGEPAIASISVQEPDLFTCHWHCLTGQAISDIQINAINN